MGSQDFSADLSWILKEGGSFLVYLESKIVKKFWWMRKISPPLGLLWTLRDFYGKWKKQMGHEKVGSGQWLTDKHSTTWVIFFFKTV